MSEPNEMNFDEWVAAAPSADEIMNRLAQLADETRLLKALLRQVYPGAVLNRKRGGRMSPEREAITDAVRAGCHTPAAVAEAVQKDPGALHVAMGRMARRGMLVRVEHGYYRLPDEPSP